MSIPLTEIACVIDKSGSMASLQSDAIGGFNHFLEDQKKLPGDAKLTLILFDHEITLVANGEKIQTIQPLDKSTYVPKGGTALLDAIGETIERIEGRFKETPETEKPQKVIIAILTDGEENSSSQYSQQQIFEEIKKKQEKEGWEFLFLGANQDAFSVAGKMSISAKNSATYETTSVGIKDAYNIISQKVTDCRTGIYKSPLIHSEDPSEEEPKIIIPVEEFAKVALEKKSSITIEANELNKIIQNLILAMQKIDSKRSLNSMFDEVMERMKISCDQCAYQFPPNSIPDKCKKCDQTALKLTFYLFKATQD